METLFLNYTVVSQYWQLPAHSHLHLSKHTSQLLTKHFPHAEQNPQLFSSISVNKWFTVDSAPQQGQKSMCANYFNSMITYSCPVWGISLILFGIKWEVNFSTSGYVSNYSVLFRCSFRGETAHFLKKLYPPTECYFSLYISNRRFPTFCPLLPHRFNM